VPAADPRETPTFKLVVGLIEDGFERREPNLAPDTDLVLQYADDPEALEGLLQRLQRSLDLDWPTERDGFGLTRHLQLFLPPTLTIADLCAIVDAGAWPVAWTKTGRRLLPFLRP